MKQEPEIVQRKSNDTLLEDVKNDKLLEVSELPPNKETDMSRIPAPLHQTNISESSIDLNYVR